MSDLLIYASIELSIKLLIIAILLIRKNKKMQERQRQWAINRQQINKDIVVPGYGVQGHGVQGYTVQGSGATHVEPPPYVP